MGGVRKKRNGRVGVGWDGGGEQGKNIPALALKLEPQARSAGK